MRSQPKAVGFIVVGASGPMIASTGYRDSPVPILAFGRNATLFPTRQDATRAIRVAVSYSKKRSLGWEVWANHRIVAVTAHQKGEPRG